MTLRILDVRPAADFVRGHRSGAVNIPLESLLDRIHELAPPDEPLTIYDRCRVRARWAASRLRTRGRTAVTPVWDDAWLTGGAIESGSSSARLWRPHALLEEA